MAKIVRYILIALIPLPIFTVACTAFKSQSGLTSASSQTLGAGGGTTPTLPITTPTLPPSGGGPTPTGQLWYVRTDGGNATQCNGRADAAYPHNGQSNQACAFSNPHYLWSNDVPGETAHWKIAGGDTVIFKGGPFRIGYKGPNSGDSWGHCAGDPGGCGMPTIPAGTASVHTKLLGANYANCTTKTQLHGGYGLGSIINLTQTQHVDVSCLELTDYAQCADLGVGQKCNKTYPLDDYASVGVKMDTGTADVSLTDLDVHGLVGEGFNGPVGGTVNVSHVRLAYNASSGWDFDDGHNTSALPGSAVSASYLVIQWNGCIEEYPIAHQFPAGHCYDQGSGGWAYGDGVGTPDTTLNFSCDHCQFDHNTQDGLDLLHTSSSQISITNSTSFANEGQAYKIGGMDSVIFRNNIAIGNCNRMSQPISGATPGYNANLTPPPGGSDITNSRGLCRANGTTIAIKIKPGGNYVVQNNSVASYGDITWGFACGSSDCSTSTITFQNNMSLGYQYPGGVNKQSALFDLGGGNLTNSNFHVRDHNVFYNFRYSACPSTFSNETCADPQYVNAPNIAVNANWSDETLFDGLDLHLRGSSPGIGTGISIPGLTVNMDGVPYGNPPNIGAY